MIITSIIGFSVLMVTMFAGIKYFVDKNGTSMNIKQVSAPAALQEPKVEYSSNFIALVRSVTDDELIAFDIEKNQEMNKKITVTTKVSDGYGGAIPLSSIEPGDIVEVIFQEEGQKVLSINKTSKSWIKSDISGVTVNAAAEKAVIGRKTYKLAKDAMLFRENGMSLGADFIGEYDVLKIQGIEDTVWSIKMQKSASSIELTDVPSGEGRLEINRTRMIPLEEVAGPISVVSGRHKIVVNIEGYKPFVQEINLMPEERLTISLKEMKEAFTELKLAVASGDAAYSVQVGDKSFIKGQKIVVRQGKYEVTIKAEGYKEWKQNLELNADTYDLNVVLQKEAEEKEPSASDGLNAPDSTTVNTSPAVPVNNNPDNTAGNSSSNNTGNAGNGSYTVNISTDPSGAYVYIGGIYKGETPFKATLPVGDYAVSLEKDGYKTYNTTVIVGSGSNQNSFLYVLTPE